MDALQQPGTNSQKDRSSETDEHQVIPQSPYPLSLTPEEYSAILEACIPSEEIRSYLFEFPINAYTLGTIIWNAPISIYKKAELLEFLAAKENIPQNWQDALERQDSLETHEMLGSDTIWMSYSFFARHKAMQEAIDAFESSTDAIFSLVEEWFDEDILDEKSSSGAPFLSSSKAIEYIAQDIKEFMIDEDTTAWYVIEKWVKTENENLVHRFTYTCIGPYPVYFKRHWSKESKPHYAKYFSDCNDGYLNIPLPYTTGDIVWIDCVPFAPPKPALIIESPQPDSCYPTILSADPKGAWSITGLKRAFSAINYADIMPPLSPCYKIRRYKDPLPPEEAILLEVRDWLHADSTRGAALWNADYQIGMEKMTVDDIHQLMKTADSLLEE